MQIRHYWSVIARRWPVVAAVVLLTIIGGGLLLLLSGRQYTAEVRVLLNRVPTQDGPIGDYRFDDYYRFVSTEYLLDDLVEEVRGNQFAQAVLARMHERGYTDLSLRDVERALQPTRAHRILTVEVVAPSRPQALEMAQVVEMMLTAGIEQYAPPDGSSVRARVIHLDDQAQSNLARLITTYAVQVLLALLLGLGLAILLDYLDDRMRGIADARALGMPVLAHIPAAGRNRR